MANEKNTIYVGGLADEVTEKLLNDIFIVFGDIVEIQMPTGLLILTLKYISQKVNIYILVNFSTNE